MVSKILISTVFVLVTAIAHAQDGTTTASTTTTGGSSYTTSGTTAKVRYMSGFKENYARPKSSQDQQGSSAQSSTTTSQASSTQSADQSGTQAGGASTELGKVLISK